MAVVREVEAKRRSAKAEHRKELMDPLLSMKQYVEAKRKIDQEMTPTTSTGRVSVSEVRYIHRLY